MVQGTWKDPSSIEQVVRGCQALLFVQRLSFNDDAELQEARIILNLAKVAGVKHVAFSSSVVLNNPNVLEDIGHLSAAPAVLNKAPVEDLVKASGMTWTLLRPGYFMTNLLPPIVHFIFLDIKAGQMRNSYGPDCILTLVDPDDIGAFAAATFNDPKKFDGKTITIVGENVRFDDVVKAFSKAIGRDIEAIYRTEEETKKEIANPLVSGNVLCIGMEHSVDMDEVRGWGVPLTTFKEFLDKHRYEPAKGTSSEGSSLVGAFAGMYTPTSNQIATE